MQTENEFLPRDDLSEAMYASIKLDAMLSTTNGTETTPKDAEMSATDALEAAKEHKRSPDPAKTLHTAKGNTRVSENLETTPKSPVQSHKRTPWMLRKVLAGAHQGWVRSIAVDPVTNAWFATGGADAQIKVWDLAAGSLKATIPGHIMGVRALTVSSRHPYLFSGSEDKTLRCFDLERTNAPAGCQIRDYHGHVGGIYALALHPELDLLFSAGRDSAIRVWDIRSRTQVMVLTGHRNDVTSLVTQTGEPQICSSSMDSTVKLWDLRMQRAHVTLTHHTKSVRSLQMHPHELTMVSADSSGSIKQWLLPEGRLLHAFSHIDRSRDANIINTLQINPATNELFAGYNDGRMQFFDYESGNISQETQTTPSPGTDHSIIYTSAFDMSGMRLITGENDKSIKIWGAE
ncbi:hypothetical protein OXX59_004492 [Metschnikowia pulcherrima]